MDFKSKHSLIDRIQEARKIREKFPGRVPVIVERARGCRTDIPEVDKNKFLVPADLTVGQFMYVIRKRLALAPEIGVFLFVNGVLPMNTTFMRELYAQHADLDGFLYTTYSGESTFGGE